MDAEEVEHLPDLLLLPGDGLPQHHPVEGGEGGGGGGEGDGHGDPRLVGEQGG